LWRAASPAVADLDRWLDFLQGRRAGADRHTTQVFLFDRRGRLALRTVDLPPASEVVRLVGELAAQKA
ncbi:MAG TPA: SCO family protein, partial [Variovorax sp.]|nr:SCO family protein [Variovorax sp.]